MGTCFAESWLRKENGGAIMFMGASISQPWNEPMRGQDYFMDVLIGGYDYSAHPGQNGVSTTEQRTTLGAIIFNGLTLMCVESGGSADWETASTWNLFGDPSLQARTATPADLVLSNDLIMVGIPFTTTVTSSQGPVANAMVTLSQDNLFFTGITDGSGSVTIEQSLSPGSAKLVVTAFNTETIYEDQNVIPAEGPYVTIASVDIDDAQGNGNDLLDYGETIYLTIGLANVGSVAATGVSAAITTSDEYVSILDGTEDYGTIPPGEVVTITNGYQVNALGNLPDLHIAVFELEASGESARETWSSSFVLPGHAPVLEMTDYTVNDSAGNNNGRLDPGELGTITINVQNNGASGAYNAIGTLSTSAEYITISNPTLVYGDLASGAGSGQSFEIMINESTPAGFAPQFVFDMVADMNITAHHEFVEYVGQIPVLILDWDNNHNSPSAIEQCLTNLQVGYDRMEAFPADRNLYASIFVCLGTYDQNHVLTEEEGQVLADYLNQGGNLYMEGADTWYYDQMTTPTPVHPMFNITGIEDGSNDLSFIEGQAGSIVEGTSYSYNGDNSYIDHIIPVEPAQMMFMNTSPSYGAGISYDGGTYKTVGFSFEFGGLLDGDKNKDDLMIEILEFFGFQGLWTSVDENNPVSSLNTTTYPNPFSTETVIRFETKEAARISVGIFNLNGQRVNTLMDASLNAGTHEVSWNGTDGSGNRMAGGIYFYRLQSGNDTATGKLMLLD